MIGRFLEHSRIFYYYNDGRENIFLSSADWMPRNLNRRVEILFPVIDEECRQRVLEILCLELLDTERARIMQSDSTYKRYRHANSDDSQLDSQKALMKASIEASQRLKNKVYAPNYYEPQKSPQEIE